MPNDLSDLMVLLDTATSYNKSEDVNYSLVKGTDDDTDLANIYLDRLDRIAAGLGAIAILLARKDEEAWSGWQTW